MSSRDFNMLIKRLREARADIVAANRDLRGAAVIDDVMPYLVAASRRDAQIATARREGATRRREDIRRNERRRCVAYIHAYANGMNDPSARAALNTCADGLGKSALPLENETGDAS